MTNNNMIRTWLYSTAIMAAIFYLSSCSKEDSKSSGNLLGIDAEVEMFGDIETKGSIVRNKSTFESTLKDFDILAYNSSTKVL